MKRIIELMDKYREILSYLFWGIMTTVVSWGTYSLFTILFASYVEGIHIFGLEMSGMVFLANLLSWVCSITFAFFSNKYFVFRSKCWKKEVVIPEFGKFLSARIVTGIVEIVAVPLLVGIGINQTVFGVDGMVAKILVSVMVVILNYVFSKLLIFK